jgi:hypothetical protein
VANMSKETSQALQVSSEETLALQQLSETLKDDINYFKVK